MRPPLRFIPALALLLTFGTTAQAHGLRHPARVPVGVGFVPAAVPFVPAPAGVSFVPAPASVSYIPAPASVSYVPVPVMGNGYAGASFGCSGGAGGAGVAANPVLGRLLEDLVPLFLDRILNRFGPGDGGGGGGGGDASVSRRLAGVERRLDSLEDRIEDLRRSSRVPDSGGRVRKNPKIPDDPQPRFGAAAGAASAPGASGRSHLQNALQAMEAAKTYRQLADQALDATEDHYHSALKQHKEDPATKSKNHAARARQLEEIKTFLRENKKDVD